MKLHAKVFSCTGTYSVFICNVTMALALIIRLEIDQLNSIR